MNSEVNEVKNDLIIISFNLNIVIIFISYIFIIKISSHYVLNFAEVKHEKPRKTRNPVKKVEFLWSLARFLGRGDANPHVISYAFEISFPLMILYYV